MIGLPSSPAVVRELAARQLVNALWEALRPGLEAITQAFTDLSRALGGSSLGDLAKILAKFTDEGRARRHHAHYARHAGRPRSRNRRGRARR